MDEIQLIRACKDRNENAFRELIKRYSKLVFSISFRILNDEDDAKDAGQEVFISVWNSLKGFDDSKSFKSWLYKIVVNKCLDTLRRNKKTKQVYPDDWEKLMLFSQHDPERELSNNETANLIIGLTEQLSTKQKIVFVLSELEELTSDEILVATGMSKDSIKSNLNHARRHIGKMLRKHI